MNSTSVRSAKELRVCVAHLVRPEVEPEIGRLVVLHEAQLVVRAVHHQEVRHDGHDFRQPQLRQLDLQHELEPTKKHSAVSLVNVAMFFVNFVGSEAQKKILKVCQDERNFDMASTLVKVFASHLHMGHLLSDQLECTSLPSLKSVSEKTERNAANLISELLVQQKLEQ